MEATTLEILDVVGTWVSAVITSLWLSYNSNKVKLKIRVSARVLLDSSRRDKPMLCFVEITNIGNKPVKINTLGWRIKRDKEKREFYQNTEGSNIDKIPLTLTEGSDPLLLILMSKLNG